MDESLDEIWTSNLKSHFETNNISPIVVEVFVAGSAEVFLELFAAGSVGALCGVSVGATGWAVLGGSLGVWGKSVGDARVSDILSCFRDLFTGFRSWLRRLSSCNGQ